ncbi:flavin reductase family protein [Candidatus Bathyarchaeota archaeon]|nr:flavin reductase family protein [Candidatus Bathyarchaeota archaeon]
MRSGGLFLVAKGKDGKPNAMTIGWGFLGTMWSKPVFVVAVRLSRHTHKLLEESDSFTVCLPAKGMEEWLNVCGTKSGRDIDKFSELGMTAAPSKKVKAPNIGECPVHVECEIVYRNEMKPGQLMKAIEDNVYPTKDLHVLYYGEIKGVYAAENAGKNLA